MSEGKFKFRSEKKTIYLTILQTRLRWRWIEQPKTKWNFRLWFVLWFFTKQVFSCVCFVHCALSSGFHFVSCQFAVCRLCVRVCSYWNTKKHNFWNALPKAWKRQPPLHTHTQAHANTWFEIVKKIGCPPVLLWVVLAPFLCKIGEPSSTSPNSPRTFAFSVNPMHMQLLLNLVMDGCVMLW